MFSSTWSDAETDSAWSCLSYSPATTLSSSDDMSMLCPKLITDKPKQRNQRWKQKNDGRGGKSYQHWIKKSMRPTVHDSNIACMRWLGHSHSYKCKKKARTKFRDAHTNEFLVPKKFDEQLNTVTSYLGFILTTHSTRVEIPSKETHAKICWESTLSTQFSYWLRISFGS